MSVDGSVQDARMGFHISIVGYLLGIVWDLMIRLFCLLYPILLHVKPVNAAASRALG